MREFSWKSSSCEKMDLFRKAVPDRISSVDLSLFLLMICIWSHIVHSCLAHGLCLELFTYSEVAHSIVSNRDAEFPSWKSRNLVRLVRRSSSSLFCAMPGFRFHIPFPRGIQCQHNTTKVLCWIIRNQPGFDYVGSLPSYSTPAIGRILCRSWTVWSIVFNGKTGVWRFRLQTTVNVDYYERVVRNSFHFSVRFACPFQRTLFQSQHPKNRTESIWKQNSLLCLLSSYSCLSCSLPCGGLPGVYGRSDQSRDEDQSYPIFH